MSGVSKACCSIPPIVAKGYQPKGEYKTINGLKTYVTGPENASKAILVIYDIFGFFPQTLQGADILSTSSKQQYRVFMPDFFEGQPADISWFPPQTDEHKEKLGNFFNTKAAPQNTLSKIPGVVSEANALAPPTAKGGGFESWSILGYCWGGKIAVLSSGSENKTFKAAVQCHPAMLDPNDAKGINIPMALLASKDESPEDVSKFGQNLGVDNYVETFPSQIHGWMAARSDLENEEVKKEYERGYQTALGFLEKHA
ncbi:dienelactone hydrolase family protein [Aspergillus stella-maris]|uniref:dienelactone hydrolase family protein n=1 Tax=Aspergillus stella-maris TaxID=1810926 RepID=UPI003CCD79C5